ncbi:hypothetical protein BH11MYX1_BH11MYX1_27400 [soil metagenome]
MTLAGHSAHYLQVLWGIATALGGAVILALVAVYRWATREAEAEEVERILADDADDNELRPRPKHIADRNG